LSKKSSPFGKKWTMLSKKSSNFQTKLRKYFAIIIKLSVYLSHQGKWEDDL